MPKRPNPFVAKSATTIVNSSRVFDYPGLCSVMLADGGYHIFKSDFTLCGWPGVCDCKAHDPLTLCGLSRQPFKKILMGDYFPLKTEMCKTCLMARNLFILSKQS